MRGTAKLGELALLVVIVSGCAFSNVNMQLPTDGSSRHRGIGKGRTVAVVVPFTDRRSVKHRCGMQKNGFNMDTADATCDRSPTNWLAERLLSELDSAGFQTTEAAETDETSNDAAVPGVAQVEGSLLKLFVEPVIGFWTGSIEADLHTKLRVTRPDGLEAEREFFSKGILPGQMMSVAPSFESALRRAAGTMMDEIVLAIAELLDSHPQLSEGR
jgi:hypothetical protein